MDRETRRIAHTLPYLAALFGCSIEAAWDIPVTWQTFDDREAPGDGSDQAHFEKSPSLTRILHGSFRQLGDVLEGLNIQGAGVFISVNSTDLKGRKKENIQAPRAFWIDLDQKAATQEFRWWALPLRPSIVAQSGHGHHVYWLARDRSPFTPEGKVVFEQVLRQVQEALVPYGADKNLNQVQAVLRVPGLYNRKRLPHELVELVEVDPQHLVNMQELLEAFPAQQRKTLGMPVSRGDRPHELDQNYRHAEAYLAKIPGAEEGHRNATRYKLACFLVRDKALTDSQAFTLLYEWDGRCRPPEGPHAVWGSLHNAHQYGQNPPGVGLFHIHASGSPSPTPTVQGQTLLESIHQDLIELFHTPDQRPFASVRTKHGTETFPVDSKQMADWIRERHWRKHHASIREDLLTSAVVTLGAKASFDGGNHPIHHRVARLGDIVYIDTCRQTGEVIQVTPDGWDVVSGDTCQVRFVRSPSMNALPIPVRGGTLAELRPFVLGSLQDFQLVTGWVLVAFGCTGQYPLLGLYGEAGSAKTFLTKLARMLVDPCSVPFQGRPSSTRDLYIRARHSYCLAFNNLSEIPQWFSDDLCGIAMGSGFVTRELHTDTDEILIQTANPIICNGVPNLFRSSDLADRAFTLVLDRIPSDRRIPEHRLWTAWAQVHPRVFGSILDMVSSGLRGCQGRSLAAYPRMADVAVFLDAAEEALLGGEEAHTMETAEFGPEAWQRGDFLAAMLQSQRDGASHEIQDHPVTQALLRILQGRPKGFYGTVTELLNALNAATPSGKPREWPKAANKLSEWLRINGPSLRALGLELVNSRGGGRANGKMISIHQAANPAEDPHQL